MVDPELSRRGSMTNSEKKVNKNIMEQFRSASSGIFLHSEKIISNYILEKEKRSDYEFLPAALSILEIPPSPVSMGMIKTICALTTVLLLWMIFGKIDIIAVAQGKIQPSGRVKTIQPLEAGRVSAIRVRNGQHVSRGEILIELDPAEAIAEERGSKAEYFAFRAETLRRRTALNIVSRGMFDRNEKIKWPDLIPPKIQTREDHVLEGDIEQIKSSIQSFDAQINQKENEKKRLEAQIASQESLIGTLKQRVDMRKGLLARGSTSKAAVIDAMESLQTQETTLAGQKGQLNETKAALIVLQKDKEKTIKTFIAENQQKASESERQADDLEQKAIKAHVKTDHMSLKSPVSGMISGLTVTSKNQVVQSGEELMRIVPDDTPIEIEAYVENKDIGFIKEGQEAVIKVESFPFTRFGTINAVVKHVSHDAIPEPDASTAEGVPARSKKDYFFGGGQRAQNLVFLVNLDTSQNYMPINGIKVPLSSGMAVSVEIKTGKRRIINYIFSPLVEVSSRAMIER